jgi:TatD DNase family protein
MIPFVDSHAHLASASFDEDRDLVLLRAREAGAEAVVCIGESLDAARAAAALAAAHPGFVFHTAGVHPHDAATWDARADPAGIREQAARGAVAVGECGLDYHYDHSPPDAQRRAFDAQLALAAELRLPAVVHTREAEADTRAALRGAAAAGVRGVLHCFTGSPELAEAALEAGWHVSFAGIVTFRKWDRDDVVRAVPAERLLVESDAPYLAPVPNRGKRNEPAWVGHTVARLAAVRGAAPHALGAQLAANARAFFGLANDGRGRV